MTYDEVHYIVDAIEQIALHSEQWMGLYQYSPHTNDYHPLQENPALKKQLAKWFDLEID